MDGMVEARRVERKSVGRVGGRARHSHERMEVVEVGANGAGVGIAFGGRARPPIAFGGHAAPFGSLPTDGLLSADRRVASGAFGAARAFGGDPTARAFGGDASARAFGVSPVRAVRAAHGRRGMGRNDTTLPSGGAHGDGDVVDDAARSVVAAIPPAGNGNEDGTGIGIVGLGIGAHARPIPMQTASLQRSSTDSKAYVPPWRKRAVVDGGGLPALDTDGIVAPPEDVLAEETRARSAAKTESHLSQVALVQVKNE